jgi:hypothetical protein
VRFVTNRGFGWQIARDAVSRRPPISLYTMVPRTGGYACDVGVWDFSIVQGPLYVAPCQTLSVTIRSLFTAVSRVSPPGPLSISYGHVGCLNTRAFPPPV